MSFHISTSAETERRLLKSVSSDFQRIYVIPAIIQKECFTDDLYKVYSCDRLHPPQDPD